MMGKASWADQVEGEGEAAAAATATGVGASGAGEGGAGGGAGAAGTGKGKEKGDEGGRGTGEGGVGSETNEADLDRLTGQGSSEGGVASAAGPSEEEKRLEAELEAVTKDLASAVQVTPAEELAEGARQRAEGGGGGIVGEEYLADATFEEFGLSEAILKGVYDMGFKRPSKIQADTLPYILSGRNVIGQAKTGSGKTACFAIAMLTRVDPTLKAPQALCLCNTRELARGLELEIRRIGKHTGVGMLCTGSTEVKYSKREPITDQIIIATPGRLNTWIKVKAFDAEHMKVLVFDEADAMLGEDGFREDSVRIMRDIAKRTANKCQVLLFSATFDAKVQSFVERQIPAAVSVTYQDAEQVVMNLSQFKVVCRDEEDKYQVLADKIYPTIDVGSSIIFCERRDTAHALHKRLNEDGHKCSVLTGGMGGRAGMDKEARDRVMDEFRSGVTKVLIATNVLARGIDVDTTSLVINYDLPVKHEGGANVEMYRHRIGRSARFGRKGASFSLVTPDMASQMIMQAIETDQQRTGATIVEVPVDDEDAFETVLKQAGLIVT